MKENDGRKKLQEVGICMLIHVCGCIVCVHVCEFIS